MSIITINHSDNLVRLVDGVEDNANELTLGRASDGRVVVGITDRDGGNTELWITVEEAELIAALAVTKVGHISQD